MKPIPSRAFVRPLTTTVLSLGALSLLLVSALQSYSPQALAAPKPSPVTRSDCMARENPIQARDCWIKLAKQGEKDLSGANLVAVYLGRADLTNANLTKANLGGANLKGANLTGADLSGASLLGADLSGAILTNAKFDGATGLR